MMSNPYEPSPPVGSVEESVPSASIAPTDQYAAPNIPAAATDGGMNASQHNRSPQQDEERMRTRPHLSINTHVDKFDEDNNNTNTNDGEEAAAAGPSTSSGTAATATATATASAAVVRTSSATSSNGGGGGGASHQGGAVIKPSCRLQSRQYTPNMLPAAPPIVTEDTPDVWHREHIEAKRRAEEEKEAERVAALKQKKEATHAGLGYQVSKFFSNTGATISNSVKDASYERDTSVWEGNMRQARNRLCKYWPDHEQDGLIVEFDCEGLHDGVPVRGHLLLTRTALLFLGKPADSGNPIIVDAFPLDAFLSYSKGVSVPLLDRPHGRFVVDLPNERIAPDAVQLYASDGSLVHFINLSSSILKGGSSAVAHVVPGTHIHDGHDDVGALDRFINYFDHAWREARYGK